MGRWYFSTWDFMGPSRIAGIWIVKIYRGSFVEAVPAKGAVA
jgi:hypothetical protein